ncbi:MAG: CRISPR-associated helicase Cas3' [Bryobacteraceae bacterium]|nr:CRISPR-associated helicase Cas3' [Bryobacteraceae bacterium]
MEDFTSLWAKTGDKGLTHPVVCHLLDTAAVCRHLLDCLPPAAVQRLQRGLRLDATSLRAWVSFLAGAHDTGKAAPPFQFKPKTSALERAQQLGGGVLYANWRDLELLEEPPHGVVTACTLPEFLQKCGVDEQVAGELAAIVGGHHGSIPSPEEIEKLVGSQAQGSRGFFNRRNRAPSKRNQAAIGNDPTLPQWRAWRTDILATLATFCGIAGCSLPITDASSGVVIEPAAAVILAGITTMSDWIASDAESFPYAGENLDLGAYIADLDHKALAALKRTGWLPWQPHTEPQEFSQLFKFEPRGLQTLLESRMRDFRGQPALYVVEAPTGEGKTEAALTVAHWNSVSDMPGTYIGMPTQATGNALYKRLCDYIECWYPDQRINVQLVHSAARLDKSFSETICRLDQVYDEEDKPGGAAASEWFVHRKRALLAPWGVGTADQALVGILRKRHQFLRLLGLAGKTVILDEVHAYDSYTSRLVDRLVHWCAILGSPVVVLSATLSQEQRQRLVESYACGLGQSAPKLPEQTYPRLTVYSQDRIEVETFDVAEVNRKRRIHIRWIDEADIPALLGRGPTAIIRSSVRRCQTTAQQFADALVFHSRFTQEDRERIEQECHLRYGKPKRNDEPPRPASLLVATQVIEQSLDVDFDVLISDLCPIDLLIQRIGRLWRHDRKYRGVSEPVLYLIQPTQDENGLPNFGEDIESRPGKGSYQRRVYDRHALLRSWYLLRHRNDLILPTEIDSLIEAAYNFADRTTLEGLNANEREDWECSLTAMDNWQRGLRDLAKQMVIPERDKYCRAWVLTAPQLNDGGKPEEAFTRLVEDSEAVILNTGSGEIAFDHKPQGDVLRSILRCQVKISNPGLIHELRAEQKKGGRTLHQPSSWRQVAYLRDLALLTVPAQVGPYYITYDCRLGLRAERT